MKREVDITLTDAIGKQFEFKTLRQIQKFCNEERDFWVNANSAVGENIAINQAYTKLNHLQAIVNKFDEWKESEPAWDENTFNNQLQQLNKQQFRQLSGNWIWHGHAFVPLWIDLHNKSLVTADSFLSTVLNQPPNHIAQSVDHLKGHILGYEFLMQDDADIAKRRNSESRSIKQLRDELNEKNNELIEEVATAREGFETLYNVRQKLAERQIKNQTRKFNRDLSEWQDKVTNLENTYEELLRLKKPADYWNKAASRYGRQGSLYIVLLIVLGVLAILFLADFFTAWLEGEERSLSLSSIQGAIIFGSLVAVFAFLVRALSRLAFSSFHLMRDAEEREQLTYLYLSLSEQTKVSEESRGIILQALFSRTETGLLKEEHGPTMPSASEALKLATKSRKE